MHYDLIVIGEDPDGLFRAMAAARDGARVAVVSDRSPSISMELLHEAVENVVDSSQGACEDWRAEIEYFGEESSPDPRDCLHPNQVHWLPP